MLIATDFGQGTMNESGYARQVRVWTRGEELQNAKLLFEGNYEDIFSFPFSEIRPDGNYYGVLEGPTFFAKFYIFITIMNLLAEPSVKDGYIRNI